MEIAKSLKRMIHIETCKDVLFIGGRSKELIPKKNVWRVWSSDLTITLAQFFGNENLKSRFRMVQAKCILFQSVSDC
jgi:hypothetical protein